MSGASHPCASLPFLLSCSFPPSSKDGDSALAVIFHAGVSLPQALLCWPQRTGWPCPYIS